MMIDNTFKSAHEWHHKVGQEHYARGDHVLATCACGVASIGITTGSHGRIDRVETRGGDPAYCSKSGADHRARYVTTKRAKI